MTTTSTPPRRPSRLPAHGHLPLATPRLPQWAPVLVGVVRRRRSRLWSACCSAGASSAIAVVAVLVFVRGRCRPRRASSRAAARAVDRLVDRAGLERPSSSPCSRWSRCSGTVVSKGAPALSSDVPHLLDAQRRRRGRRASTTRIVGTLLITLWPPLISVPIGLLTAIYLVEYGRAPAGARDHLPRRRDDRHPLDRGRPVRLRAVRRCSSAKASGWASAARSRCRC